MKRSHLKHQKVPAGKIAADSPFYQLIQNAYRVFKQAPTEHAVCDCCMCPEIRKDFFNHKQADLPLDYIQDWFFAAADIPMNQAAWRFVLPRILEVLASGEEPSNIGLEVSLSRFETGKSKNWSAQQWAVLDEFQKLYLSRADLNPNFNLDDVICMFASAGWPSTQLFEQVSQWPMDKLVKQLWKDWCNFPNPSIWITAFWDNESDPMKFYTSQLLLEKITSYALDNRTSPELAEMAMTVSDLINSYSN